MTSIKHTILGAAAIAMILAASTAVAAAPTLTIGTISAMAGSPANVNLTLANNGTAVITGLTTDITYDANDLTPTGVTTAVPGKVAEGNVVASGTYRITVSGGVKTIPDGPVATVTFDTTADQYATDVLAHANGSPSASDAAADAVTIMGVNGNVTTTGGSATPASSGLLFYPVSTCRAFDTRIAGGPMAAGTNRSFQVGGLCGVPTDAQAVSLNVTVTNIHGVGFLRTYPEAGAPTRDVSTLNYSSDQWALANAAIVPLRVGGAFTAAAEVTQVDVIFDVTGYFLAGQAGGSGVPSVNGITGAVTIAGAGGTTVNTAGSTITVSSTTGGGALPTGTSGQTLRSNGSAWTASSALINDGTNVGIENNLLLPTTQGGGAGGVVKLGADRFLHNYGRTISLFDGVAGNTFLGDSAGNFSMGGPGAFDGALNTGLGHLSLTANTTGYANTAAGWATLAVNTTGNSNTAIGAQALSSNTKGVSNTAVGTAALWANTTTSQNTAVGADALFTLSWGVDKSVATDNTAVGYKALYSNQPSSCGPGLPYSCGPFEAVQNTAVGSSALSSNTTGSNNTSSGAYSLYANTTGYLNTASGSTSLFSNTTGSYNTASGSQSLQANTRGHDNTASGASSLYSNTSGTHNTASGSSSLFSNTIGTGNTANGYQSLHANTEGDRNTASGWQSLLSNTTGQWNTANGAESLSSNTTGSSNTSDGFQSLFSNTTGTYNTASGSASLHENTTGSYNIAVGDAAGINLTTGDYNIDIGNGGVPGEGNTIRIGDVHRWRTFLAGIRGVTTGNANGIPVLIDSNGQLGTISSSIRFKRDVADMGDASSRLMELRPVTFHYKTQPDGPLQYGLIAEEVNEVMPELVVHDATGQVESVAYHELPAMLLNELQKQRATFQAQIADQAKTIQAQQAQIESLVTRLAAIEARLAAK
ncbi:MAG: tail fiber domain-containing protein [Thermoanaerobaculales bacterium]